MIQQFRVQRCGGAIVHTDKPQTIMARNADRVGGYVANDGDHVLTLFAGQVIELAPWRGVLLPAGYVGPVHITGQYEHRFSASEFLKP